jgi:hypothetical protein
MQHADTEDTENGYLPVSRLAIAAAVVGVVSAAAVANTMFLVVPLVGVALAVAGLADVGRDDAPKAGRMAALAGLALSIGFGLQSAVHLGVSLVGARGRAVAVAEAFAVAVAEGRHDDAVVMCRYDALPESLMAVRPEEGVDDGGAEVRKKFVLMPTIAALTSCGGAEPRVEQSRAEDIEGESWVVTLAVPCSEAASGEVVLDITVARDPLATKHDRWLVTGHTLQ